MKIRKITLLSRNQVADMIGVSRSGMANFILRYQIPYFKVGDHGLAIELEKFKEWAIENDRELGPVPCDPNLILED